MSEELESPTNHSISSFAEDSPPNSNGSISKENSISSTSPDTTGTTVIENDLNTSQDEERIANKASEMKEHDALEEEKKQADQLQEEIDEELIKNDGWEKILGNDQLIKKVIKAGTPNKRPLRGEICTIKLRGQLQNDEDIIFESYDKYTFQLGDAEVIPGLDLSIPLMSKGETAHIKVASRFGYGSTGLPPLVPENADLFYEVELLDFETEKELEELSIVERKETGISKRNRGNWWYERGECSLAIQCYRRALEFLDEVESSGLNFPGEKDNAEETSKELKIIMEERLKTYNNMSAAQIKIQAYEPALTSVEAVLRCQPDNVKALFRKGKILAEKGDVEKALDVFKRASELEPNNKAVLQEIFQLTAKRQKDRMKEKQLYKRMFDSKDSPNSGNKQDSTSYFKSTFTIALLIGGLAVAVAGATAYRYRFI